MIQYSAFNAQVFAKVPLNALSILDVGCGTGVMGNALKLQNRQRIIKGITYSKDEAELARRVIDKVWVTDINKETIDEIEMFDCIIFSHILEHTFDPEEVLKNFLPFLKRGGVVLVALPNVLHFRQRIEFIKGRFQYSKQGGLMDVTHFRFFDWDSAQRMITNAGLQIISKESVGNFPLPLVRRISPKVSSKIDSYSIKRWPGLFGFQFIFVATQ